MSVGSAPHIPKSELNTNDVDTSVEEKYVALERGLLAGATMANCGCGRYNPRLLTTGSTVATPAVQPPAHLAIYHPNASNSDEGTPDTGNSIEGQSHGQGECLWLVHDMAFNNETIKAEFVELEYEGSEIKPGVLNILQTVNF